MKGYIYRYYNSITGKSYIGQTTDLVGRKSSHKGKSEYIKNKFYNSVRKYGWGVFKFSILTEVECSTIDTLSTVLDFIEEVFIQAYNSFKNGYNSTPGGHAPRGMKRSEEYREYCRKRTYSDETRRKMSISASNRETSEETREKCRQNALKRNFSKYRELTTEKRNAAIKKAKAKQIVQLNPDKTIVQEFDSIKDAVNYIKTNIAPHLTNYGIENAIIRHCKGKTKKEIYYGFIWKYKTDV